MLEEGSHHKFDQFNTKLSLKKKENQQPSPLSGLAGLFGGLNQSSSSKKEMNTVTSYSDKLSFKPKQEYRVTIRSYTDEIKYKLEKFKIILDINIPALMGETGCFHTTQTARENQETRNLLRQFFETMETESDQKVSKYDEVIDFYIFQKVHSVNLEDFGISGKAEESEDNKSRVS